MTDIAQLAVEVKTGDVVRARAELDKLTAAGGRAERAADQLTRTASGLGTALRGVVAGLGVAEVIRLTDAHTKYTAQLRLATGSAQGFAFAQEQVRRIATDAQADIAATGTLYARISKATQQLGISQTRVSEISEVVALSLKANGASASEAASAMLQLSQAFGSGVLRGEEFNAVNEASPRLMQALADGIGKPIGALRQMATDGKLTSKVLADALPKALEDLRREAAQVQTIGGSFTVLRNSVLEFVGTQAKASGAVSALSGGVEILARNLDTLAAVAIGFGAAKLAQTLLTTAVAAKTSAAGALQHAAALQAERAASIALAQASVQEAATSAAAAQAQVAETRARVVNLQATEAGIVVARADIASRLSQTQATIVQANAQINAARAAGAQSFALATLRQGTDALAAAQLRQAALVRELAILGTQQARVQTATAAAMAAQTAASGGAVAAASAQAAAQRGLAVAATTAGTALTIGRGILAALGGPIGIVTTALLVGIPAWIMYGNSAKDAAGKAEQATARIRQSLSSDVEEMMRLDAILARLRTDNRPEDQARIDRLERTRASTARRVQAARDELDAVRREQERNEGIGRHEIARRVDPQAVANRQRAALTAFLESNQTKAEKFTAAIARAKSEMGAFFNADVEKRIRSDIFGEGPKTSAFATEIQQQKEKLSLLDAELESKNRVGEVDRVLAEIESGKYGKTTQAQRAALIGNALEIDQRREQVTLLAEEARHREQVSAFLARAAEQASAEVNRLVEGNQALREEIELLGHTDEAKAAVEKARVRSIRTLKEEQLAMRANSGESEEQLSQLRQEIELLKQREELIDLRGSTQTGIALRDGAKTAGDTYRSTLADSIEQGILDGSRKGLDLMEILRQELVAQFARTILRPVIQPIADAGNTLIEGLIGAIGGAIFGGGDITVDTSGAGTPSPPVEGRPRGGRASGGTTQRRGMYEVAEGGKPELYEEDGRTYLMTGGRGGMVTPARSFGDSGGAQVVNNVFIEPPKGHEAVARKRENKQGGTDTFVQFREAVQQIVAEDFAAGGPASEAGQAKFGWNPASGAN